MEPLKRRWKVWIKITESIQKESERKWLKAGDEPGRRWFWRTALTTGTRALAGPLCRTPVPMETGAVQRAEEAHEREREMDESAIKPTNGAKRSKCVNKRKALDKAL